MFSQPRKTPSGFTLIELVVAMAIVAILTAIAVPTYRYYVMKAKRSDAMNTLSADQSTLERCYAQYLAYNSVNCGLATGSFPQTSQKGYYIVTAPVLTATQYTLTATATASQAQDTACSFFTITQTNTQTATSSVCWQH
jgi:type IV pilus assembly protein PilE